MVANAKCWWPALTSIEMSLKSWCVRVLIPELSLQDSSLIRIPNEQDVFVTPRVVALLDTQPVQRLKRISQLGLVAHVYPGATHTRFAHSLGVFDLARRALTQLLAVERELAESITEREVKVFLAASLLHDVGHWPYCHPIEDLQLDWVPHHEHFARRLIEGDEIRSVLEQEWGLEAFEVADFLERPTDGRSMTFRILQAILNGPIDIDKMDYLQRDSLHAGVPYGRNFDQNRLIASMCVDSEQCKIAITAKGKTAAEMMVFARYVMFSEVYWHHAVRSSTAMLQRIVYQLAKQSDVESWLTKSDAQFEDDLLEKTKRASHCEELCTALFGRTRQLYKRMLQFSFHEAPEVHAAVAGRPYDQLLAICRLLAEAIRQRTGADMDVDDLLLDAPPVKLEVQFRLNVKSTSKDNSFVPLSQISPVVESLATNQFDNFVKRVRLFVHPNRLDQCLPVVPELPELICRFAEQVDQAAN